MRKDPFKNKEIPLPFGFDPINQIQLIFLEKGSEIFKVESVLTHYLKMTCMNLGVVDQNDQNCGGVCSL